MRILHMIILTVIGVLTSANLFAEDVETELTDLSGPRVARSPMPSDFIVTKRLLRQGVVTDDGSCRFKETLHLSAGEKSIDQVEIAYDQDTCRSLVVQGHYKSRHPPE